MGMLIQLKEYNLKTPSERKTARKALADAIRVELLAGKMQSDVAKAWDVSRERIRQIYVEFYQPIRESKIANQKKCLDCGSILLSTRRYVASPYCGNCFLGHKRDSVQLECKVCGVRFARRLSSFKAAQKNPLYTVKNSFCSRKCLGKWNGTHYGWGRRKSAKTVS